jgi:hypothetical protein
VFSADRGTQAESGSATNVQDFASYVYNLLHPAVQALA